MFGGLLYYASGLLYYKYQILHIFAQFGPLNKTEEFFSYGLAPYSPIWAIKACLTIKHYIIIYDNIKKNLNNF